MKINRDNVVQVFKTSLGNKTTSEALNISGNAAPAILRKWKERSKPTKSLPST